MPDLANVRTLQYSAFISYSHADAAFARRLHRKLETYRLPRRLGRPGAARPVVPRRLRPVFLDRAVLTAAPDLSEVVRRGIAEASALIVICSPNAAQSQWVGREIALFRSMHDNGAILAALIAGVAPQVFPPALRQSDDNTNPEPLAADFQREADGPRLALLKLVAALAEVGLDDLVQRDAQRRIRRITAVSIGAMAGMAAMGVLTVVALNARAAAERERERGARVIEYLLTDLRGKLKSVGRLDVLDAVNQGALRYYSGQDLAQLQPAALDQRAGLLQAIGSDDLDRGKYEDAAKQFNEALRTTAALMKASPNNPKRIYAHALSEYWVGALAWRIEDAAAAEQGFGLYAKLAARLAQLEPHNPDWVLEVGYSTSSLATVFLRHSLDLQRAEPLFRTALAAFETAARRDPHDTDLQDNVADGYGWLGDIERLRCHYAAASADRAVTARMIADFLRHDPDNAAFKTEFVANQLALARIDAARAAYPQANTELDVGATVAAELAGHDPDNRDAARQVRIIQLFKARTALMATPPNVPPDPAIAAAIGDCSADRKLSSNDELVSFCQVLRAADVQRAGNTQAARRILADIPRTSRSALTVRWGINLDEEIAWAMDARFRTKECSQ